MFRRRTSEIYPALHRLISRHLLAPRNLALLLVCTILNILRDDWLTTRRLTSAIPLPANSSYGIMFYCADFFTFALIVLAALAFSRARRDSLFSELRLAGASWGEILLPLRDTIIALTLASAILEIVARAFLSREPTAFEAQEAAITGVLNLATAWFFALLILLMNVLGFWVALQIVVYVGVCLAVLAFPYFFMDQLFESFLDLTIAKPRHALVQAFSFPGSSSYQVASTLSLTVIVLGISAILTGLTPLLGHLARWRAEKLLTQ